MFQFAHIEFQKNLWIKGISPDIIGDHTEAICTYFDDLSLDDGYQEFLLEKVISPTEHDAVKSFHNSLSQYSSNAEKQSLEDSQILIDTEWIAITNLAKKSWEGLKLLVDNEFFKYMCDLEEKYLVNNAT